MASAPHNSPNLEAVSLDQYLEYLETLDKLDLEAVKDLPQCFQCHQACLEVFAKQIKFSSHRDFCSAKCFKLFSVDQKKRLNHIPKLNFADNDERKDRKATKAVQIVKK